METLPKRYLIRHLGNMGDMIFFIPPLLETLKRQNPNCRITFVTGWGFKMRKWQLTPPWRRHPGPQSGIRAFAQKSDFWGERNQSGFSLHLLMTNPFIDELIHWHDTDTSTAKTICHEDGRSFQTWSRSYYEEQKASGLYDQIIELDFGVGHSQNPVNQMYQAAGITDTSYTNYRQYLTREDKTIAKKVMSAFPHPRIVILESIEGTTTRGWDPDKVKQLAREIQKTYNVDPVWFGGKHVHMHRGRELTMRENIATLLYCSVGIGVLSGPLHFAAAIGLPTITLYGDHPMHRAAPAYFLNKYIKDSHKKHRTILGSTNSENMKLLKNGTTKVNLTPAEWARQAYRGWQNPGRQATKSCISVITVDEVMTVLADMLH